MSELPSLREYRVIPPKFGYVDNYWYMYHYPYMQPVGCLMAHVTYTELRANLAGFMDEVCNTRAPLLVTRQNARSVVMVSEEDYEGLMETVHVLRSPANALRLLESIEQAQKGELTGHDLIEPTEPPTAA